MTRRLLLSLILATIAAAATAQELVAPQRFEVVLAGGRIVDGTGAPWYVADVGIQGGKIARIGRIERSAAARAIDASGLVVAPGFIDMMGQTATPLLEDPKAALNLITQGITTINAGEGVSAAPLDAAAGRSAGWQTMGEYFQLLDLAGLPVNVVQHPRAFGAFPRLFSRYVRELGGLSLPRAVAQASAAAANNVMAYDRGRIAVGLMADIVVFDAENIADRATFAEPERLSTGVKFVLVNGHIVLDDGKYTGARPGRVLRGPGYREQAAPPNVSTGASDPRMAGFDRLMRDFLRRHHAPGAALAVTDRGRLVYARGYGYADVAAGEKVTPQSLFRIASISKPVTAVAILRLVEQKRLSLDDKVFEILEHKPHLAEGATFDERQRVITIRHLLEHRAGWDRAVSFDAMFRPVQFAEALGAKPPAGTAEVIRNMLGHRLDFVPGERYAYSNYGYCLLGRVIEQLTGKSYEDHVRQEVLAPLGIRSMRLGKTRLDGRQPGEVRYYSPDKGRSVFAADVGQSVPQPYGAWHLEAMDAHGGWLASAADLARFAAAFDDPQHGKLLTAKSIEAMHARPPGLAGHDAAGKPRDTYYSLGWINRDVDRGKASHWHTGSLPGTATLLLRRHDGRNFVVLFNARSSAEANHFGAAIDPLLQQAADEVKEWPREDLFR